MVVVDFLTDYLNTTTVIFGISVLLAVWWATEARDLPPGPWNWPIVGALPMFLRIKNPEDFYSILYKKYGPIVKNKFGSSRQIAFLNFEAMKESFIKQGDNFSGKPQETGFKVNEDDSGIGFLEGECWKEHRRFVLSTFRDFGMGKHSLEPRIMIVAADTDPCGAWGDFVIAGSSRSNLTLCQDQWRVQQYWNNIRSSLTKATEEEIQSFMDELVKQDGKPVDWAELMRVSVTNVICSLEFGSRFEYDDPQFLRLRGLFADGERLMKYIMFKILFPWTSYIPFFDDLTGWNKLRELNADMKAFFQKKMDEHQKVYQDGSRRDFIDAFYSEKKNVVEKTGDGSNFSDGILKDTLIFLFVAGNETIVSTMQWAVAFLLTQPKVLEKVQKEIDEVIGMERRPSISYRSLMTYTEAFMNEVHRFGSVVPVIAHNNLETTTVMGYRIPKRSLAAVSLLQIHQDPEHWQDPKEFRPERFIDKDEKLLKTEHLLAFGAGKRNCIGESLARMEFFLYLTTLLQRFDLKVPEGETISLETSLTITRHPKSFTLCFTPKTE